MKHEELTRKIIGCAMKVHSALGNGFSELIYQRALALELEVQNLSFAQEIDRAVYYKGEKIGSRRIDFLVENAIILELEAVFELEAAHFAQIKNYLEAYNFEIGLLINFGSNSLTFKRLENKKFKEGDSNADF